MRLPFLALLIFVLLSAATYGQSVGRTKARSCESTGDDRVVAAQIITALKRLENDVIIYRSLEDLEASGKIAIVSLETFQKHLQHVTDEVQPMLDLLKSSELKAALSNALASYRDGRFWWARIYQPRVVHVSALGYDEINRTPSDNALLATIPYTVAIHWRQAAKYLKRAEALQNRER